MGPGPRLGSSNQAAWSFDDLAVCIGPLRAVCLDRSGTPPPWGNDGLVFDSVDLLDGFTGVVLLVFGLVEAGCAFLAFLVCG